MTDDVEPSISLPEHIETIFKVRPPLDTIENGHGYMGVLLRNKKTDKVQCHICGKWFGLLGRHIGWSHKIRPDDYRVKYHLPLGFPLCGKGYSTKRSKIAMRKENLERMRSWISTGKELQRRRSRERNRWTKSCLAVQNAVGGCKKQIVDRYIIACDKAGKEIGARLINKYDPPLMGLINRRFGGIGKFKEENKFTRIKKRSHTKAKVIAAIRRFAIDRHRIPTTTDFKGVNGSDLPGWNTIVRNFGSYRRALSVCGFEHFYRKHRMVM